MDRVLYSNYEIRYQIVGDNGPLVFLVHGFGGGPQDFRELVLGLSTSCRCVIPNIRPFFTSAEEISFDEQVEALRYFINQFVAGETKFSIISSSYGSCLSASASIHFSNQIDQHYLINPMPFSPFANLRSLALKALFKVSRFPGAMRVFFISTKGQALLLKLGRVFNFGSKKLESFSNSHIRKLNIIERAVQRFFWINGHVDWDKWQGLTQGRVNGVVVYSTKDPLFSPRDYEALADHFAAKEIRPISHRGHFLTRTKSKEILEFLKPLIASSMFHKDAS